MPAMTVIAAPRMVVPGRVVVDAAVVVADGHIQAVLPASQAGRPDVVLADGILAPGLVDAQVNGCFGVDFMAATPDDWLAVAARLPETGVTAFVPTYVTAPIPELAAGLGRAERAMMAARPGAGARLLGVHVEGPFLAASRRGAHNAAYLCDPTPPRLEALLGAATPGTLLVLTLAPERPGALDAVRQLDRAGVVVSVGHTDAVAEQVAAAADAGACMVTHLFNAQRGLHHREPGVVGHALVDPRLTCGLILDLWHVAADVARLAFAAAPGRIALITDAVAAAGMPPGDYQLGGEAVHVGPGAPPVRADGVIAGSTLRLDEAVGNAVALGIDPARAVAAASAVPADLLGRPSLGRIVPGMAADLVWLGEDYRARATWVGGRLVYGSDRLG